MLVCSVETFEETLSPFPEAKLPMTAKLSRTKSHVPSFVAVSIKVAKESVRAMIEEFAANPFSFTPSHAAERCSVANFQSSVFFTPFSSIETPASFAISAKAESEWVLSASSGNN